MSKVFGKEVSVIIPKSCFDALDILANEDTRTSVNVAPGNPFLFPPCSSSLDPVSGYHDIMEVCRNAKLKQNLCADKFRHLVSTEFSALDLSPDVKTLFFKHMGHSKNISESVYQMPRALRTMVEIAPILIGIDERTSSGTADLTQEQIVQLTAGPSYVTQPHDDMEVNSHMFSDEDENPEEIQGQSSDHESVFGSLPNQKYS